MTAEFSRCDTGAPAGSHFHSWPLVWSLFKGKRPHLSDDAAECTNVFSEKGIFFPPSFQDVLATPTLKQQFTAVRILVSGCFDCFPHVERRSLIVSGVKEPTDTPTVGLLAFSYPYSRYSYLMSFSLLKVFLFPHVRKTSSCFGQVISRISLFLCIFFPDSTFLSLSFLLIHPSMPVFQSALTAPTSPLVPLHWLQSSLQQCHTRTRSHKGRRKKKRHSSCSWRRRVSASYFTIGRNLLWRFVFEVARNTNSRLCVRTCIRNGIITTVLDLFLYDNLSSVVFVF